jgi:putative peptidoglycan lipid II flippase
MLALPFCLIRDIMSRVFFSHGNTLTPVFLSLVALVINSSICFVFYNEYGLVVLAIAVVVSTVFNCIVAIYLVQKNTPSVLILSGLKILMLCGIGGTIAYSVLNWLDGIFAAYWLIVFIPFVFVYCICLQIMRVQEVIIVTTHLRSLFSKIR